jgi:hypothetical protein
MEHRTQAAVFGAQLRESMVNGARPQPSTG